MNARKEAVAPKPRIKWLIDAVLRDQDHKRGEIFICAAEAITEPCAHAGTTSELGAGLEKRNRRIVIDSFGVSRFHETKFIHHFRGPRHQVADPCAALAMLGEFENRAGHWERRLETGHAGQPLAHADALGKILAITLVQKRLVIKQVELRWTASHE